MKSTVLLVDDEDDLINGIRRILHSQPLRVLSANGAEAAMEILEREMVDVIISDEQMPGVPGSEFLAQVRRLYPGIQRMMLSGRASLEAAMLAINEGHILRYLVKPCPPEVLAEAIAQALRQKRLMERCRQGLLLLRRQSALIGCVARSHPEVMAEARNEVAAMPMDVDDAETADDLGALIADQVALDQARGR